MAKNNVWQWDETAANNSDIAGIDVSGATGKVKDGDNVMRTIMSQIITMEGKGADVASAGTLTLGTERYYHVTGTTTITDIDFTDAVDGRWAWLIFDGALTLTHNSTTLKLPGGANITTVAGDRALFVQDSSDNIICLSYAPANANPLSTGTTTPTATSSGGSLTASTTSLSWTKIGKEVFCHFSTTLTTVGTASGQLIVPAPFSIDTTPTPAGTALGGARETTTNGTFYQVFVNAPGSVAVATTTNTGITWTNGFAYRGSFSFTATT